MESSQVCYSQPRQLSGYTQENRTVFTHTPPLANPALRFSAPVTLNIEVAVFATLN